MPSTSIKPLQTLASIATNQPPIKHHIAIPAIDVVDPPRVMG